jgi:hypothetical protein
MKRDYKQVQGTEVLTESRNSSQRTNSDSDSDNLIDVDQYKQKWTTQGTRCFKLLALFAPVVFFAFVAVAVLIPVLIATVAQTVNRDCELVANNMSLPTVNRTLIISDRIQKIFIVIPESSIAQRHQVDIRASEDTDIHIFMSMRALSVEYLPLLTLNTTIIGTTLNITFLNQLNWPGYGCPLISLKLQFPTNIVYDYVYVKNLHNGTIVADSVNSKVIDFISGSGLIDVSGSTHNILNVTLEESMGSIHLKNSRCLSVVNSTINAFGGEIRMNNINSCNFVNAISTAYLIVLDRAVLVNGKVRVNSNFGNITLTNLAGLSNARVESKTGFLSLSTPDPMDSTFVYLYAGGETAAVTGFDKIEYDISTVKEKSGRVSCAVKDLCQKTVFMQTDSIGSAKFVKVV